MIAGLRDAAVWPSLEALAHTLVYDSTITATFPLERLATMTTPSLVVNSDATDERLLGWGRDLADALPNGSHRTLPGEWHGVTPWVLAPVLADFYST
jgi:hypothetical protein